jgi:hypothetical protein
MRKLTCFLICISFTLVCSRAAFSAPPLTSDQIDTILEKVDEDIDNEMIPDATNQLKVILKELPKHSGANERWKKITGSVYVPPIGIPEKPSYTKAAMQTNVAKDMRNTFGIARGDMSKIVGDSTKSILNDSIKDLASDPDLKKQLQALMLEAIKSDKNLILKTIRSSLELPSETLNQNTTPTDNNNGNLNTPDDSKVRAQNLYNSALKMLDERRFDEAKKMLQDALQLDPTNQQIKSTLDKIGE